MPLDIEKKQELSQGTRKIILWSIMIIIAAGLIFWWIKSFKEKINSIGGEEIQKEINLPLLKEQFKDLPQFDGQK